MHDPHDRTHPLRVGSLFSGYGGLDLAVEHALDTETIWFSENNGHVSHIFAHHWPDAPNLGDITTIDWRTVEPVDVLCGGFPCQDVSTVGKRAGLAPGTRSGLWSYMAAAIDALQPQLVVIENVRGLLSSPAVREPLEGDDDAQSNPDHATPGDATLRDLEPDPWGLGDIAARPLRAAGAVLGDLADLRYDAEWIGLPASLVGAPHHRFRIFIVAQRDVPDPARNGLFSRWREPGSGTGAAWDDRLVAPDHRPRLERTGRLSEQMRRVGDLVDPDRRTVRRWGRYARAIAQWEHVTGQDAPAPALLNDGRGPRLAPAFVEWLMGLEPGWVTDPGYGLTQNQQITALGNGVLPLQAVTALVKTVQREHAA
ncbi:DNA cytosine methyltransferase [Cumulibacter manganitolerans]|uniref:DNA cytosine methyltransferase n=1 Tax=Cumulibacter manganitolerans TaxID=1884992 RepID=UPI001294C91D|nr:DNA cytosine methyltransferase [Cumulibacter manganitolerans]MBN9607639.1 DNA cytosine methyltransferase [Actinomycetales bacterium]